MEILQHDISGSKWDQQALMLAVESAPSGLLILDSAGKIQSANRAVENLFGYSRQELLGQPVELLPAHPSGRRCGARFHCQSY